MECKESVSFLVSTLEMVWMFNDHLRIRFTEGKAGTVTSMGHYQDLFPKDFAVLPPLPFFQKEDCQLILEDTIL